MGVCPADARREGRMIHVLGSCSECGAPMGIESPLVLGGQVDMNRLILHLNPLNGKGYNCDGWIYNYRCSGKRPEVLPWMGWPPNLAHRRPE